MERARSSHEKEPARGGPFENQSSTFTGVTGLPAKRPMRCAARRRARKWHIAMRPGKRKQLDTEHKLVDALIGKVEQIKAKIRAKVEHPFRVIKCQFIEKFGLLTTGRDRHTMSARWLEITLITGIGQNCPKTRVISCYQGKMTS